MIEDLHKTPVQDEAEASSILYGNDGTITFLKEGPVEVVAHSETPYERHTERLIVCHGKCYRAHYGRYGKIELTDYRSGLTIGRVREFLFLGTMVFKHPVPLDECVFIALLIMLDGDQCHPHRRRGMPKDMKSGQGGP